MAKATAEGRKIEPGVNWIWYTANTREDAIAWFTELTGSPMTYDWIVSEMRDGRHGFRLRRQ